MRGRFGITILAMALAMGGCDDPDPEPPEQTRAGPLVVESRARGSIQFVGQDTLSAGARILALHPELDGEAVAMLFADTIRGVSSGLAVHDERTRATHLVWPDSVTSAWWTAPHTLSFTTATGDGVFVVVDVHDAELEAVRQSGPGTPPVTPAADQVLLGRAQQYVDSIRVQPGGVAQNGAISYLVTSLLPDPTGRLAAFYVAARDTVGRELNPSWYIMDLASGQVTLVDEIVGAADELPRRAAGWTENGRFVYAKGPALYEAAVRAAPDPPVTGAWRGSRGSLAFMS